MLKFITRLFHKPEKVAETVEEPRRRSRGPRQYYDGPDDFKEGEVVTGIFVKFYQERHSDLGYALMSLEDGRKTRVSLQYLKRYWPAIDHLKYGDRLTLIRHGWSETHEHSVWEVKELPVRIKTLLNDPPKPLIEQPTGPRLSAWPEEDEDFELGMKEEGRITKMLGTKSNPRFAIVEFSDLADTRVSRIAFEKSGLDIADFKPGDTLTLEKIGYIPEHHITKWNVNVKK